MFTRTLCIALALSSAASVLVYWDCPHETYLEEQRCLDQMGVKFSESPSYNIPQLLSNCRSRKGGESYQCFMEATSSCNTSAEVKAIIYPGLEAYLEPGLDYICSYDQLIEDNQACFEEMTSRQEPYGCYQQAVRVMESLYNKLSDNDGMIDLEFLKYTSCKFVTRLSSCHYNLTLATCGDSTLAQVISNFWYSSNGEWCE